MIHLAQPLDLAGVLMGGQAFTWRPTHDGAWEGPLGDHWTTLHIDGDQLVVRGAPAGAVTDYLDLDGDASGLLSDDPIVGPLARSHPGLRVLRQDPWEAVLGFLTSPVNNVPRIAGLLERLGRATCPGPGDRYRLPDAQMVAGLDETELREMGFGFRSPRILDAARHVAAGRLDLDALADGPIGAARDRLLELDGVGPKVAECILAFAVHRSDAFPVDRWVQRAVLAVAPDGPAGPNDVRAWGRRTFGDRAALAQQVLFHAARHGDVPGLEGSPFRAGAPSRTPIWGG